MVDTINLYLDDSGTRHPDHKVGRKPKHGHDWFALGGILIRDFEEERAKLLIDEFCKKWEVAYPLRSANIRAKSEKFRWLTQVSEPESKRFYDELYTLMITCPVQAIACTIDRPGYNARYYEKYGRNRWALCKTAFSIVVERASKIAISQNCKLRVNIERGDKKTDGTIQNYYKQLKSKGMPFAADTSERYGPLSQEQFSDTLYEFRTKAKSSKLTQLADLYLWPMAIGGYDPENRTYKSLMNDKKIVDALLQAEAIPHLGCKYSCFDSFEDTT